MATEIERKFLVKGDFTKDIRESIHITQGYLSRVPERTVRVRIYDKEGFLTIKGKSNNSGLSRYEFEKEINYEEALELLKLCEKGIIDKIRHLIDFKGHTFEVDLFKGENEGLIMAEIELEDENETFETPEWLGEEITGDKRYFNSNLSKNPYKTWNKQ